MRWSEGERLEHLFERRCDDLLRTGKADNIAVETDTQSLTFKELDDWANQLARHLKGRGIKPGDRVGLIFDRTVETYVALLAVLKAQAAYVPLDAAFPDERIGFIIEDASISAVLTMARFKDRVSVHDVAKIFIDEEAREIENLPHHRINSAEGGESADNLCYVIYTSGTTGKPKGVAIDHPSICNFVRVANEIYGYVSTDRVYQGMTIAFDFSVEELWVPLLAGATLIPGQPGANLVGEDLGNYLSKKRISAFCCVPTLLATIEADLPNLRFILVSGEACPQSLVERWSGPKRRMVNAYGPTEATVTATVTELTSRKPVTIGGPLPTYTIVILNPDRDELVGDGEMGEIAIAGIGLAREYLNRPDLTEKKFVPDTLHIPNNPSGRIYRTGDLGRITDAGEVEFHGRIDTQVKIRGYRIELAEIEALIETRPEISQAVVHPYESEPGTTDLVAYFTLTSGSEPPRPEVLIEFLRAHLPPYMIPAYVETLPAIPMTPSHKVDRKALPPPKGQRVALSSSEFIAPKSDLEKRIAKILCDTLNIERASLRDHFFQDLGGHSLLMARFCSIVRRELALPSISMRDVYRNPTIESLASHLGNEKVALQSDTERNPPHVPSNWDFYTCGALQLATYLGLGLFGLWLLLIGFHWTYAAIDNAIELYFRIFVYFAGVFTGANLLAVATKWLLIGRWKPEAIPIWSLRYFRFWLVKLFVSNAPAVAFVGGPLFNLYLRLLGAHIGKNVVLFSGAPIATDIFSVGDDTIVKKGSLLPGYFASGNQIHIGSIAIGKNAFVGTASVVDINTRIGDNAQLGHSSCLPRGERIADGKRYHGTPAEETTTDYCRVDTKRCTGLRRWLYSLSLASSAFLVAPLPIMLLYYVFPYIYAFLDVDTLDFAAPLSVVAALAPLGATISLALFVSLFFLGLLTIRYLPKLIALFLREDRVYVLFGIHYFLQGLLSASSRSSGYNSLFGDSSYIVYYLKWANIKLGKIVQTGANFGLDQVYDHPMLCEIGTETMVSDGLAMSNIEMSNSSFRLGKVRIGAQNYLGNNVLYPAGGRTGDTVLIATKAMIPLDGSVRSNTGLLGSPCFEIPRTVQRDSCVVGAIGAAERKRLLWRKNRYNTVTMFAYLLRNWFLSFVLVLTFLVAILYYPLYGGASLYAWGLSMFVFTVAYLILAERLSLGFGSLEERMVSMYDPYFLKHERHWKFCVHPLSQMFNGTPFKSIISRMQGVKLGKKVFDDGANIYDKTLIEIGDHVNLNTSCVLQGHSLEEGAFKSGRVKLEAGSSVGCAAFVHYSTTLEANASLDPNAFLMKGETIPANARWLGNPAQPDRNVELIRADAA